MANDTTNLPEFIFGHLSTTQGRVEQSRLGKVGLFHDCILIPAIPKENDSIEIRVHVGAEIAVKRMTLYYRTGNTAFQSPFDWEDAMSLAMKRFEVEWDTLQWCYLEQWRAIIPGQPQGTFVQYAIAATTTTDQIIYCPHIDLEALKKLSDPDNFDWEQLAKRDRQNQPQIYEFVVDDQVTPDWFRDAIIYQIFVDRFAPDPGKDFKVAKDRSEIYGGTLKGIISKLDYLENLGINCLWLTPIFPSPSHHGYDPSDYGAIEPRLGTLADWELLVTEAHQRGMKLILDYVANHISNEHDAFQSAIGDRDHPKVEWFRFRNYPLEYDCFFDVSGQPEVNPDHGEVRDYLISNACQWLQRGCDGFRLDYAHAVGHAFWSVFRAATRQVKADSITFGEITQPPSVVRSFAGRMDGCLDFQLLELLRGFFVFNRLTVSQFDKALGQHFAYFGSSLVLPSFLDNHDMNRFLWAVNGDKRKLKLAALCQFTLPNPPIIYYGTEVGLSQLQTVGRLEESRLPMLWDGDQDQDLLTFYQQLIQLRRQSSQDWYQQPQALILDDLNRFYGYQLGNYACAKRAFGIALNNQDQSITLVLPNWKNYQLAIATDPTILWNESTGELTLSPFGGVILNGF